MTQTKLNAIRKKYDDRICNEEDPDKVDREYVKEIKSLGGEFLGCDWKEFGGGSEPFANTLINLLEKKTGCKVLDDPQWTGSDYVGIIIFWKEDAK